MKRILLFLALISSASSVFAADPFQSKGFSPDKVFAVGDIDSVNVFNGNLIVRVPIGQVYTVGPTLQYQFMLTYNGKIWDYVMEDPIPPGEGYDYLSPIRTSRPERRSNSGLGWTLSLGRLLPANSTVEPFHGWIYIASDGSEHEIIDAVDPTTAVSRDGSYLRLRRTNPNFPEIDFPDGTVQKFDSTGRLIESRDPFGNWVRVDYATRQWTITDGFNNTVGRTHTVLFANHPHSMPNFNDPVSQVQLAAYNGTTATYTFDYEWDAQIERGGDGQRAYNSPSRCLNVPLLTSVTLPDGSAYNATYKMTSAGTCSGGDPVTDGWTPAVDAGFIESLSLPTGGRIVWTADRWHSNLQVCRPYYVTGSNVPPPPAHENGYRVAYVGVRSRTLYDIGQDASNTPDAPVWHYKSSYVDSPDPNRIGKCHPSDPTFRSFPTPGEELINVVEAPNGLVTKHYFSIYPAEEGGTTTRGFRWDEYGLPLTHNAKAANAPNRLLSTEIFDCSANDCGTRIHNAPVKTPLRKKYVTYDQDQPSVFPYPARNARVAGERTVYLDDSLCQNCYTDTARTQWDDCGHFRQSVDTSSIPGTVTRTSFIDYQNEPCTTPDRPDWFLNTYSSSWTKVGDATTKSITTFVAGKGVIESVRSLRDVKPTAGSIVTLSNDLMVVSCRDASTNAGQRGYVTSERYVGGDGAPIPAGAPASVCSANRADGQYFLEHLYWFSGTSPNPPGALTGHTSYWNSVPSLTADASIDSNTGLVFGTRDASEVMTDYDYDWAGRVTDIYPEDRATTTISYHTTQETGGRAMAVATRSHPTGSANASEVLPWEHYSYDGFGRLVEEAHGMPGAGVSRRRYEYDPATGAKTSVSELGDRLSLPKTTYTYDVLGRIKVIEAPDNSETTFEYEGDRVKTRTVKVATSANNESYVEAEEHSDGFGKLIKVRENSGGLGQPVETSYTYDTGGRLASVTMTGAEGHVQNRIFDYDGAGLLRWESHPESGVTSYSYDARGHVLTKNQSAAASPYDLQYSYDGAERLTSVFGRNPHANPPTEPEFRVIKSYEYASANILLPGEPVNRQKGKLLRAYRYNYPPEGPIAPYLADIYVVKDYYDYAAPGGQVSLHTRSVGTTSSLQIPVDYFKNVVTEYGYTDLGNLSRVVYPWCVSCGGPESSGESPREVRFTYDRGRLSTIPTVAGRTIGYVNMAISYWDNGLRHTMQHSNGITDTQDIEESTLMTRPKSLTSALYDSCTTPVFAVQPVGGPKSGSSPVPLSVTVTGSGPFQYQWYADGVAIDGGLDPAALQPTYYASPQQTTEYFVEVRNACRPEGIYSDTATVSVNTCDPPSVTAQAAKPLPDGTWKLEAMAFGADPLTVQWYRKSDNVLVGTGKIITLGPLNVTTTYTVKVSQACSSTIAQMDVKITIPLPMTTTGLNAVRDPLINNKVVVSWPASAGAAKYQVQRRSKADGDWVDLPNGLVTGTSFTDLNLALDRTYAYRVYAMDSVNGSISAVSNSDAVTLHSFVAVVTGQPITPEVVNDILFGVNAVREAAGWAPVTWSNIVASNEGIPAPGATIRAAHLMTCRARLNEALQALGVPVTGYTDPNLYHARTFTVHFTELQDRMK
jgi:hypothetical protein